MGKPDKDDWYHAVPGELNNLAMSHYLNLIAMEVRRSIELHGCPLWGRHEAYAIIKEELDEVWDEVKKDGESIELTIEVIQTAAMCVRYLATDQKMIGSLQSKHPKLMRLWNMMQE